MKWRDSDKIIVSWQQPKKKKTAQTHTIINIK